MGIKKVGAAIRNAREQAGLTQAQMAEGICSPLSLSRMETGRMGVRPEVFQRLMQRAGQSCSIYAAFQDRNAFQAFLQMEEAAYLVKIGNPMAAYQKLRERTDWDSVLKDQSLLQKFGLTQVKIQLLTAGYEKEGLREIVERLLCLSMPEFNLENGWKGVLSTTELELLLIWMGFCSSQEEKRKCIFCCENLSDYLQKSGLSFRDKYFYLAATAMCYSSMMMSSGKDTAKCLEQLEELYKLCVKAKTSIMLPLLYFQIGIISFKNGRQNGKFILRMSYFAERAKNSIRSSIFYKYVKEEFKEELLSDAEKKELISIPQIPWIPFSLSPQKNVKYTYYLGDIIHDCRQEKGYTLTELCKGLCTKATLSKIENNYSMPGKSLCDALLQRLGMSGDLFFSYCDSNDFRIYELQRYCIDQLNLHTEEGMGAVREGIKKIRQTGDDKLYEQFCLSVEASVFLEEGNDEGKCQEFLKRAFLITQSELCEYDFGNNAFTYNELSILNKMAFSYWNEHDSIRATQMLYQIIFYLNRKKYSFNLKENIFPVTISRLCRNLYSEKKFGELLELKRSYDDPTLSCIGEMLEKILIYYSQALGELGETEQAVQYGKYAAALLWVGGKKQNSETYRKAVEEEIQLKILI
ncbi:MAG: helix-turn-helix transcriptional regulator [Eubacteriales bacterium]|nr:helix-turn-helix transcriptional regulator [Eubacteriales bacterium]